MNQLKDNSLDKQHQTLSLIVCGPQLFHDIMALAAHNSDLSIRSGDYA